jgi:hypothetical protein
MGQNVSTKHDHNDNNIQTNIEILLQDLLERDYDYTDLNNEDVINSIQQHIHKILSKMPHDQLLIMYKQIYPEYSKSDLNINELTKYYTQKFISIMCVYTLRDNLMKIVENTKDNDINTIKSLNTTIKKIHELDEMAIMMVEEIIHTSYTSDGKMRKKRYYRERQLSKKQLDNIMKLLKNF